MTLAEKLFEEGRQEGRHEGQQEGWQKGQREGRLEGQRAALLKVLEMRFGEVPFEAQENIRRLDNKRDISLAMARAVEARSLADLRAIFDFDGCRLFSSISNSLFDSEKRGSTTIVIFDAT
jgi:predicted transposase YdaD